MERSIHIKNNIRELALLHEFIERAAEEHCIEPKIANNVKLATEEAVVNCISYAYPDEVDKDIFINLRCEPKRIVVTICDYGVPFDPTAGKDPDITAPLEERPVGGLGIYLVKQLMTEALYRREEGRNILVITKEID